MCSGQILTLIGIATCVSSHQKHPKGSLSLTGQHAQYRPKGESLGTCPEPTTCPERSDQMLYSSFPLGPYWLGIILPNTQLGRSFSIGLKVKSPRWRSSATIAHAGYSSWYDPRDLWIHLCNQDHPHIINVTTPLHQCGQLWMVADISIWQSQQSSGSGYKGIMMCKSCGDGDPKYSHSEW